MNGWHKIAASTYLCREFHQKVRYILFGKYIVNQCHSIMPDFTFNGKVYYNPVQLVMEQIGGTWKAPILWRLKDQIMRYGELRKDIPHISDKMLTTQLRELEEDGYVFRKVYAVVPPKTEYSLTEKGKDILKLIMVIRDYGLKLMEEGQLKD